MAKGRKEAVNVSIRINVLPRAGEARDCVSRPETKEPVINRIARMITTVSG